MSLRIVQRRVVSHMDTPKIFYNNVLCMRSVVMPTCFVDLIMYYAG